MKFLHHADAHETTLIPRIKWAPVPPLQAFRNRADMHTAIGPDSRVVFMGQGAMLSTLSNTAEDDSEYRPTDRKKS